MHAEPEPHEPPVAAQSPGLALASSMGAGDTSPGLDFYRIYGALLKWLWLVGLVFVIVVAGVAAWTFHLVPIYRAECSLVLDANAPQVLDRMPEVVELGGNWSTREYFATQFNVLKSRALAEKVVTRLGLDRDDDFLKVDPKLDEAARAKARIAADPAQKVIDALIIEPVKDSRVIKLAIEDSNPQRATDLVNAIADEYIEQNVDRKLDTTHSAGAWLADQIERVRKKLEHSEQALFQFKEDHDVLTTSLEARQNITSEKLVQVSDAVTKASLRRAQLEAQRGVLKELLDESQREGAQFKAESFQPVADNALINDLKREYFRLTSERAELHEKYLDGHPKVAALDERIAKVKGDIAHAIQNVIGSSDAEYRQVIDEERRLKLILEQAKQEALRVNKLELDYGRLKREKDQTQQVYDLMVKRQKEVDIAGLLKTNNIRLIDTALVPQKPVRPNRVQNILLAMAMGLLFGLGLVVLLEMLDNTVKLQEDVEQGLGLPLLGILPSIPAHARQAAGDGTDRAAMVERDLFVSHSPNSAAAECARSIRTSLLFSSPDRPFKVLLVTSTGPREGKTTTAINIGVTMAQSGSRTLLIDGDLRRPRLHRTFGVPAKDGLSTLILGESKIEDAVKSTGIERLSVLPAGPVPPNPAELLQSDRYVELLRTLVERYDRIVVDSAPVGVVTDGLVMATRADGLVLVLRAGVTQKKAAWRGRRALADVNAHIYGAILNDVNLGSRSGQYYYYYRYGYYPSEAPEKAEAT